MTKKNIIIIVVILLAVGVFFYWNGSKPSADASLLQTSPTDANIGANVLSLLNQIQSLRIDTSLFKNPAFQSFQDYTVSIPPVNVGRQNPFAPIPGFVIVDPNAPKSK